MAREIPIRLSMKGYKEVEQALTRLGPTGEKALRKIQKAAAPTSRGLLALDGVTKDLKGKMTSFAGSLGPLGAGLERLGPAGLAAGAGIAAVGAAVAASLQRAREATQFAAELEKNARNAGQTVEAYQELIYASAELQVSSEGLFDALKELNLRADEFAVSGAGGAADAYRRLGFSQAEVNELLKDGDELFYAVIERIGELDTAAQIRLNDEIFGGQGGEQFLSVTAAGADAIRRLREEAREFGAVMDRELVERGAASHAQMERLQRVIDTQLNAAFLELAPVLVKASQLLADVAQWAGRVADSMREIPDRTTVGLEVRRDEANAELEQLRTDLEKEMELRASRADLSTFERLTNRVDHIVYDPLAARRTIEALEQEIAAIDAELKSREEDKDEPPGSGNGRGLTGAEATLARDAQVIEDLRIQLQEVSGDVGAQAEAFLARLRSRLSDDAAPEMVQQVEDLGRALLEAKEAQEAEAAAVRKRNQRQAEAARIIESVRTPTEQLAVEIENLNKLYEEGHFGLVGSTEAMETLARATENAEEEAVNLIDKNKGLSDTYKDLGREGKRALGDIITGSKDAGDALRSLLSAAANSLANYGVSSLFNYGASQLGLGNIFSAQGNVFDRGRVVPFARGGVLTSPIAFPLAGNRTGIAGEAGPESIMPLTRTPSGDLGVKAVGAGGGAVVHIYAGDAGPEARQMMRATAEEVLAAAAPQIMEHSVATVENRISSGRMKAIG